MYNRVKIYLFILVPWRRISVNYAADGGGIRGLSSLYILKDLMEKVRMEEKRIEDEALQPCLTGTGYEYYERNPDHRDPQWDPDGSSSHPLPCHYFDLIMGTSTGGLIAVMLGRLRMNVDDCITAYQQLGCYIFGRRRWWRITKYGHGRLECAIKAVLVRNCKEHGPDDPQDSEDGCIGGCLLKQYDFSCILGNTYQDFSCKVALVAIQEAQRAEGDDSTNRAGGDITYLFRSYDHVEAEPVGYRKYNPIELNPCRVQRDQTKILEACRASAAAPLYFDKITISGRRYMDGGVGVNNPSTCAWNEAEQMARRQGQETGDIAAIISVGTGREAGYSRFKNLLALAKFLRKAITETSAADKDTSSNAEATNTPYFRFDVPGISKIALDELKKKRKPRRDRTAPTPSLKERVGQWFNQGKHGDHDPAQYYIPGAYQYTTYDNLKKSTERYCGQNFEDDRRENVEDELGQAAKILVWYRRRRQLDDSQGSERWQKFSEHPYWRIGNPPRNNSNGTPAQHTTQAQATTSVQDGPQNRNTTHNQTAPPTEVGSDPQNATREHTTTPSEIELQEIIPSEGQASTSIHPEPQNLIARPGHNPPSMQGDGSAQNGTST